MSSKQTTVKTDWVSDEYIKINNCSHQQFLSAYSRNVRPNGRNDYSLLFITEGRCILNIDSPHPTVVKKGNVIVYGPGAPQDYSFFPKDNPAHIYIHFSGVGLKQLFSKLKIPHTGYFPYQNTHEVDNYLVKLCENFALDDDLDSIYCSGLLLAVLSLISPIRRLGNSRQSQYPKAINGIIAMIRSGPAAPCNVEKWAKECGFTRSYFIQIFKKATGMPPHQYLTHIRMNYAKEMLIFTDLPTAKIGEICGYPDNNYFSRIFKKTEGISPSQYRKNRQK